MREQTDGQRDKQADRDRYYQIGRYVYVVCVCMCVCGMGARALRALCSPVHVSRLHWVHMYFCYPLVLIPYVDISKMLISIAEKPACF